MDARAGSLDYLLEWTADGERAAVVLQDRWGGASVEASRRREQREAGQQKGEESWAQRKGKEGVSSAPHTATGREGPGSLEIPRLASDTLNDVKSAVGSRR